jgi:hypothetical protein
MTYAEAFDGVVITRVFHEIPVESRVGLFRACYRALKRPGVFLNLDFAYPDTLAEFREPLFWSGVDNQYREMSWGTIHPTWQSNSRYSRRPALPHRRHVRHITRPALPGGHPQALVAGARPRRWQDTSFARLQGQTLLPRYPRARLRDTPQCTPPGV